MIMDVPLFKFNRKDLESNPFQRIQICMCVYGLIGIITVDQNEYD